ncbi:MAG: amidohydrolase [Cyclobacteriaceae bacterium]|nr:amidohydrolase [Cyclobacteriaceae bacterium]
MKTVFYLLLIFTSNMLGCVSSGPADLLLINGNIHTADNTNPFAEAVGVRNGIIIFAGDNGQALKLKGEKTEVIDLEGKLMTPGFIEGHGHFIGMGYNLLNLDLSEASSYEEVVARVQDQVETGNPGEWIIGRGWHQNKWDQIPESLHKGFPTHQLLSAISPDNPVYLRHASGHAVLVNKKAMEMAGIDEDSQSGEGGEIILDPDGNPTGIFTETAMGLFSVFLPENDTESDEKAYQMALNNCLKEGITSFHDAGAGMPAIGLYQRMINKGEAMVRLYVMLDGSDSALMEHWFSTGPEIDTVDHLLTVRSIKTYMDGALGSRGAWLIEPYSDRSDHWGYAVSSSDFIEKISGRAIETGFQVCTHAIGDRANRETLDIYESVFSRYPEGRNSRFRIEHAQHLDPEDIPRFARLGVLPAMQAIHMSSDRPWALDRLGERRIVEGAYVWQDLLQSGARIINGTDVPVEPISPVACFYASVTRKTLKGFPPEGYEPEQKMTREQALRSYTIEAAYGAFEEEIKGSVTKGKLADFTVFSQDIMSIPEDEILNTRVVMTIIGGTVAYESDP